MPVLFWRMALRAPPGGGDEFFRPVFSLPLIVQITAEFPLKTFLYYFLPAIPLISVN